MDTQMQDTLLQLMRGALLQEAVSLPPDTDWQAVTAAALCHGMVGVAFYGALAAGFSPASPAMKPLYHAFGEVMCMVENQTREAAALCAAFEAEGVRYMPLKGMVLRELYPKPEMRTMGDADILIDERQYPQAAAIMQRLGYAAGQESDHEFIWDKPGLLHVELHKRLIPSYHALLFAYFGDGWRLAQPVADTCRYKLPDEEQFLYLFAHFAKHYRSGGVGIRQATDLWMYLRARPEMDMAYVQTRLKALHLDVFYRNIRALLAVWFEGAQPDAVTAFIANTLFESGAFGTHTRHVVAAAARAADSIPAGEVQKRKWVQTLFPSASVLSRRYPLLKKLPVLLPAAWVARFMAVLFRHPERIENRRRDIAQMTPEAARQYRRDLDYVGLSFE